MQLVKQVFLVILCRKTQTAERERDFIDTLFGSVTVRGGGGRSCRQIVESLTNFVVKVSIKKEYGIGLVSHSVLHLPRTTSK